MSGTTIKDAVAGYLLQLDADGRSPHTITQYGRHVRLFARWIGEETPVASIQPSDLARFMVSPTARGEGRCKKPISVNPLRTTLRVFFAYAHTLGLTPTNPARVLRLARCEGPPPRGLSAAEVERLLDVLTVAQGKLARRDHLLIAVMLRAGLRIGSALGLDRADVDLEEGVLRIRTSKGQRQDRVVLSPELRDHLVGYLAERGDGPLFTQVNGRPLALRGATARVMIWFERAGVHKGATAHSLRHTFAMGLYEKTRDVLLVQRALCHRSMLSTLTYARASEQAVRAALEASGG